MTTLEVLRSARKLLSNPNRWGKFYFATKRSESGEVCYCALGAIRAACGYNDVDLSYGPGDRLAYRKASIALASHIAHRYNITSWNDNPETTYEDVMALFSKACEAEFTKTQEATMT